MLSKQTLFLVNTAPFPEVIVSKMLRYIGRGLLDFSFQSLNLLLIIKATICEEYNIFIYKFDFILL